MTRGYTHFITALILCMAAPVHAATITVTANAPDVLDGADGSCSLREAITNINDGAGTYADCVATGAYGSGDAIDIPAGTYTIAIAGTGEDANATGDYDILTDIAILGAGAESTEINGGGLDRVFHVAGAHTVSFSGIAVTNGLEAGGGFYNGGGTVSITNTVIRGNTSTSWGGGVFNAGGEMTFTGSTISGNDAFMGGGIYSDDGTLTVLNSTLSGNTATGIGGGLLCAACTAAITNSTLSGNVAVVEYGGALYALPGSSVTITHATITDNSSWSEANVYAETATITLSNTIIAHQAAGGDCATASGGSLISSGHNLDSDGSCNLVHGTDRPNNASANLDALADNGGPTQTHALLTGSDALDAGDCAGGTVVTDQRGTSRPQGGGCDIGAYERAVAAAVPALSGWGMVLLMLGLAVASFIAIPAMRKAS